jgi:hypothetical protein
MREKNSFKCLDCNLGYFTSKTSLAICPNCGFICVPLPGSPGAALPADRLAVCLLLWGLCKGTYRVALGSEEFDRLIDQALDELRPYLKN